MTVLDEGELRFTFGPHWQAEKFDAQGVQWPQGVRPVDFIVEGNHEIVLLEVKDPSVSKAPSQNHAAFVNKMKSKELTHQELAPKARSTYGFLHLMERDGKPMRYVVVIGTERLSLQPVLLLNLNDRLRDRLRQEANAPWRRHYMANCAVVAVADIAKVLPGCSATRISRP